MRFVIFMYAEKLHKIRLHTRTHTRTHARTHARIKEVQHGGTRKINLECEPRETCDMFFHIMQGRLYGAELFDFLVLC